MTWEQLMDTRLIMRANLCLTIGYLVFILLFLTGAPFNLELILVALALLALFGGPMMIGCFLSSRLNRPRSRLILFVFAAGYSILTTLIFFWTFYGPEHDAQYQLYTLIIPMFGYPGIAITGLASAVFR